MNTEFGFPPIQTHSISYQNGSRFEKNTAIFLEQKRMREIKQEEYYRIINEMNPPILDYFPNSRGFYVQQPEYYNLSTEKSFRCDLIMSIWNPVVTPPFYYNDETLNRISIIVELKSQEEQGSAGDKVFCDIGRLTNMNTTINERNRIILLKGDKLYNRKSEFEDDVRQHKLWILDYSTLWLKKTKNF